MFSITIIRYDSKYFACFSVAFGDNDSVLFGIEGMIISGPEKKKQTEEKAKVVAPVWGTNLSAALAM